MLHGNAGTNARANAGTASAPLPARWPTPRLPLPSRLPRLLPELALLAAVYFGYKYGRKVANGHPEEAAHHGDHVWSLERALRLPSERSVQDLMLHSHPLVHIANYLYATVHFPAMLVFLGYMFVRHRAHYLWIRRAIVIQTMLALLGHLFFPLAPPRLLPGTHMIDTAQVFGPAVYRARPDPGSMSNQFAAMPSLHVGWALAIAVGLIAAGRSRARYLWLLHPLITLLVVVSTANHYWVDGMAGCALLGFALMIIPGPAPEAPEPPDTHWAWPVKRPPRPGPKPVSGRPPTGPAPRTAGAPHGRSTVPPEPGDGTPSAPPPGPTPTDWHDPLTIRPASASPQVNALPGQ